MYTSTLGKISQSFLGRAVGCVLEFVRESMFTGIGGIGKCIEGFPVAAASWRHLSEAGRNSHS